MPESEKRPIHVPLEAKTWHVEHGWRRLEDLCDGVFDCPHTTPGITESGPYVVRSQDIRTGIFRLSEAGHVSEETYRERIARAEPRYGDLLYSREGTYFGIAAEVPKDTRVCLGQRTVLLRPKNARLNSRFLRYWLNSPTMARHIEGFRDGSVAERLNMPVIRGLPVPLFRDETQRAIASILGSFDDKIELNRRMSLTLEAMAQAIFEDWFLNFGPTRAKVAGSAPYLAPDIWAQFPDRLDNEGKPEGWRLNPLSDVAQRARDTLSPSTFPEELFDHYSIPAFDDGQTPKREAGRSILSNKTIVPSNAVLISKLNPEINRVWLVDTNNDVRAICSTEFLALSPREPSDRAALYCLMTEKNFRQRLEGMVTGTSKSHQRVNPDALLALDIVTAPPIIMKAFADLTAPLLAKSLASRRELASLARLRDLLLPGLMSGEIRVKEAAELTEAAP